MERFRTISVGETESTNTYARSLPADTADTTPLVVTAENQTAGRGQRGNSWESEPGKNLTFSLVIYPRWLAPSHQFELSMLVSTAIVNALRPCVDGRGHLSVKWPNDIYVDDRKIAGILIENSLGESAIERSVIGIGVNVNQTEFRSDAPNPVSLIGLTGAETDLDALRDTIVDAILDMTDAYESDPEPDELTWLYNSLLWRRDGKPHPWKDATDGKTFQAVLDRVDIDGRLVLTDADGKTRSYLFKEVSAVL